MFDQSFSPFEVIPVVILTCYALASLAGDTVRGPVTNVFVGVVIVALLVFALAPAPCRLFATTMLFIGGMTLSLRTPKILAKLPQLRR